MTALARRAPLVAATAALLVALWLTWHGPVQFLDAASYASAIRALADGHGLTTTLAPSFADISPAEFVGRGGRVPFVDFPAGYPLVAAPLAVAVGASRAMVLVGSVSVGATVWLIASWPRASGGALTRIALCGVALTVVAWPMARGVLTGGMSEPLFVALAVGAARLTVDTAHGDSNQRHQTWAVAVAGAASVVRFAGAGLVLVPVALLWRRRGARSGLAHLALGAAPMAINLVWASAAGSGHRVGLRTIERADLRFLVRACSGWLWHGSGDFDLANPAPPLWATAITLAWVAGCGIAVVALVTGRRLLARELVVCWSMAGLMALGVLGAMVLFDSLVTLDNRLLLPSGVLTVVGGAWWAARAVTPRVVIAGAATLLVTSAAPWSISRATDAPAAPGLDRAVGGAAVVVSDSADQVWWHTARPAAYLPTGRRLLTGERVDAVAAAAQLPCQLARHDGVIVLVGGPFTDRASVAALDPLIAAGMLTREQDGAVVVLRPTHAGCAASALMTPAWGTRLVRRPVGG